jgi:hypothetical protein
MTTGPGGTGCGRFAQPCPGQSAQQVPCYFSARLIGDHVAPDVFTE